MPGLIVAYDLVGDDTDTEDYERLIGRIEEYTESAQVQRSTWVVKVGADAETVCKDLLGYVRAGDRLFVAEVTGRSAWTNAMCGTDRVNEVLG